MIPSLPRNWIEMKMNKIEQNFKGSFLLTLKEGTKYLRLSEMTLHYFSLKGKISTIKFGNQLRFRKEDIERWLEKQVNKSAGQSDE